RKQLDIRWPDLFRAAAYCAFPRSIRAKEAQLEATFASPPVLSAFTVRTGFDLFIGALELPAGSEILMTALTIKEMANIVRHHGLVPIPLDTSAATLPPDLATTENALTDNTRRIVTSHRYSTSITTAAAMAPPKNDGLPPVA